jgi:tRNA-2-methylthio-N6-dimethylallyladenosine synthase
MFIYSARPGTPSYAHFDDMPKKAKTDRLQRLIEKQKHYSHSLNQRWVNQELQVLFKDESKDGEYMAGHSDQNHTVLVPKSQVKEIGLANVTIDTATPHTLYGTVSGQKSEAIPLMMA